MTDKEIISKLEMIIVIINENIDNVNQNGVANVLRTLADEIERGNKNK